MPELTALRALALFIQKEPILNREFRTGKELKIYSQKDV